MSRPGLLISSWDPDNRYLVIVSSDDEEVTDEWVAKAVERLHLIDKDIQQLQKEKIALESKIARAALEKGKPIRKVSFEY